MQTERPLRLRAENEKETAPVPAEKTEREDEAALVPAEEKIGRGARAKAVLREHFSAPRMAYMALFTALAYVVTFLEFSVFPAVPLANQLKLDFSNLFFMIEGFLLGPVEAVVSIAIKEAFCLIDSQTMGVGEVANLIMSTAYVILPAVVYRFKKGRGWVALYLALACVIQIGISLIVNRYINFPFFGALGFLGDLDAAAAFRSVWAYVLAFNAIKSVSVSIAVFLIYKPLSRFIKMTSDRFERRMQRARAARAAKAAAGEEGPTAAPQDKNTGN